MKTNVYCSFALPLAALAALGMMSTVVAMTTAVNQQSMTPSEVLHDLMAGNARFIEGRLTKAGVDVISERKATASGQYPKAVILSCLDSRVPVEFVFDQGIGDVFVGRVAGNIENEDQLGSMEFATKLAGAKLVMVLGHSGCGAVKGACDGAELGNLTGLLAKIKPAVDAVEGFEEGERNSSNKAFVAKVIEANVRQTVADIRARSDILRELEADGTIMIVGAVYDLKSGSVSLLD
ncbi:MAG TPA: carbonic anhydrase family protein [Kiritimatiellia bacterium]|nr:carbonic anhydrase family protein [Kiritimatiellia bacterium]HMO99098.1 carbonic anhydrase family protein [Kiritimatiellia bacterium]HMP96932.1 carbonic anhydrase family protein [Kiritimatiellia bacterium]